MQLMPFILFPILFAHALWLLFECLEYSCDTRNTIVLVGDFNLPHVDWNLLNSLDDDIH